LRCSAQFWCWLWCKCCRSISWRSKRPISL
jgi:hypothetical protein